MLKNRPAPRWLIATLALCLAVATAYVGWMYAEWNQFKDAGQCADTDGGWVALGIETSAEFVSGCQQWFKSH